MQNQNLKFKVNFKFYALALRFSLYILCCFYFINGRYALCAAPNTNSDWRELKGEHFIVYFTGDERFPKEVLNKAEVYYDRIASDLGYARYTEFWTWDKRVRIYIYPNKDAFIKTTKQSTWSEGMADYTNKRIISYAWSQGFTDALLPHETAHLIFRDFVGFKGEVPLWLDEGVAQWAEEWKREAMKSAVKELAGKNRLFSLEDMMKLDFRGLMDGAIVRVHSLPDKKGNRRQMALNIGDLVKVYYVQSVSLVGFLIDRYGSTDFTVFCRALRDGKSVNEALRSTYPDYMRDISELEDKWVKYIREKY